MRSLISILLCSSTLFSIPTDEPQSTSGWPYLENQVDLSSGTLLIEVDDIVLNSIVPIKFSRTYRGKGDWSLGEPSTIKKKTLELREDKSTLDKDGTLCWYQCTDPEYLLTKKRLPDGNHILYFYDADHRLVTIQAAGVDPKKIYEQIDINYTNHTESRRLKTCRVTSSQGHHVLYTFDKNKKGPNVLLTSVESPLGKERLSYEKGLLKKRTLANGICLRYKHDGKRIASIYDKKGYPKQTFLFAKNHKGKKCTTVVDAYGNKKEYHFNREGNLEKLLLAESKHIPSRYETFKTKKGILKEHSILFSKDHCALKEVCTHDDTSRILTKNLKGEDVDKTTKYVWSDHLSQLLEIIHPDRTHEKFTYLSDTNLRTSHIVSINGRVFTRAFYKYNEEHFLIEEVHDDGENTLQVIKRISPIATGYPEEVCIYTLDPKEKKEKLLKRTLFTYNKRNQVLTEEIKTDREEKIENHYDEVFFLLVNSSSIHGETHYTYDEHKNLILVKSPSKQIKYTYNSNNQLISEEINSKEKTSYTYDQNGRIASMTNPLGVISYYTYDGLGRKTEITTSANETTKIGYDSFDRIISITENDKTTRYVRFVDGKIVKVISGDKSITYFYHPNGNLHFTRDEKGRKYFCSYDDFNRLLSYKNESYTYQGRQMKSYTKDGITTNYPYDPLKNL